jgi:hypothetical protein
MKRIYFDEAGFTGNNLLDKTQSNFCYLGLVSSDEVEQKYLELKDKHGYSKQEVKGINLSKSTKGQKFIKDIWTKFNTNVNFVVHDKKYALAGKLFEYTYESVFQNVSTLLYRSNFHIFITTLFYSLFIKSDITAEYLFNKFTEFVKERDGNRKIDLIGKKPEKDNPLILFYSFCKNNMSEIACDIDFSSKTSQWLLDLTNTSLYSLLVQFAGDSNEELYAFCDKSKPLLTQLEFINAFVGDKRILYNDLLGFRMRSNFNLAEPAKLIDSKDSVSIQIADCLVSSIYYSLVNPTEPFSQEIMKLADVAFDGDHSVCPSMRNSSFSEEEIQLHFWLMKELSRKTDKTKKMNAIREYAFCMMQLVKSNSLPKIGF